MFTEADQSVTSSSSEAAGFASTSTSSGTPASVTGQTSLIRLRPDPTCTPAIERQADGPPTATPVGQGLSCVWLPQAAANVRSVRRRRRSQTNSLGGSDASPTPHRSD